MKTMIETEIFYKSTIAAINQKLGSKYIKKV